jgi:hypothetical protein
MFSIDLDHREFQRLNHPEQKGVLMTRPRRIYSDQEKEQVLIRMLVHHQDVGVISAQTGIPKRTLHRWRTENLVPLTPMPIIHEKPSSHAVPPFAPSIAPMSADDAEAIYEIRRNLMEKIRLLSHSIDEAIPHASLSERVIAATRLIDRVVKLADSARSNQIITLKVSDSEGEEEDGFRPYTTGWFPAQSSPAQTPSVLAQETGEHDRSDLAFTVPPAASR